MSIKYLSLCIPTNGIVEWVIPVIKSIYSQGVSEDLFEVVIADNGLSDNLQVAIMDFFSKHNNIKYKRTSAIMFQNQIEAFKMANGIFIKFINHRMILNEGSLEYLIRFAKDNIEAKPVAFFSNGNLSFNGKKAVDSFEQFIVDMSYYSSWSAGLAIWKSDFENMASNEEYNQFFPHINLLFNNKDRHNYIVDNTKLLLEQTIDDTKKGKYDVFYAFGVEYPGIILDLYRDGFISRKTFLAVKDDILTFLARLYLRHIILKKPCSFELSYYEESIRVFFNENSLKRRSIYIMLRKLKKYITLKRS